MRIGIIGFGHLGQHLVETILSRDDMQLAFVWNRSKEALRGKVPDHAVLEDLADFKQKECDLIVEVAHPSITEQHGADFLSHCDYMVGSPTALSNAELEAKLREVAVASGHGLYIPSGAFWGGEDIQKMADRGTLQKLKVTMTKHPSCLKLTGSLKEQNERVTDERTLLYEGSVRDLCPLAPHNVNTMAAAALAAHNLGMDEVIGSIVADPHLLDWHIVEVEVWGPGDIAGGTAFHVHTVRRNPSNLGRVTGSATYASFVSSMLRAHGKGSGVHLC